MVWLQPIYVDQCRTFISGWKASAGISIRMWETDIYNNNHNNNKNVSFMDVFLSFVFFGSFVVFFFLYYLFICAFSLSPIRRIQIVFIRLSTPGIQTTVLKYKYRYPYIILYVDIEHTYNNEHEHNITIQQKYDWDWGHCENLIYRIWWAVF